MQPTRDTPEKRSRAAPRRAWLTAAAVAVIAVLACAGAGIAVYPLWYSDVVYPGVAMADIPLGGLTRDEARARIEGAVDAFGRRGIRLEGFGHAVDLSPMVTALADLDLTYDLVQYDSEAMAQEAFAVGRRAALSGARAYVVNALTAVGARLFPVRLPARYRMDDVQVLAVIGSEFGRFESPAQDARLVMDGTGAPEITPERPGERIDIARVYADLARALAQLSSEPVTLALAADVPQVTAVRARALIPAASAALARTPLRVRLPQEIIDALIKERRWSASPHAPAYLDASREIVASWLTAAPDARAGARLAFAPDLVAEFLAPLAEFVNRPALDAKFEVKGGKVSEFQGSRDGRELDADASIAHMEDALLVRGVPEAFLVLKELKAKIQTAEVNTLGIKELLGVGTSNFSGSPQNRRHNIGVGVAAVNGTLIPPGEEFSLLHTLGDIDAAAGYLPELVIKGNRTVPEYGGGLCQIGTTVFRAALSSGMPITQRQNHSYRVRYYEPAGTDATIYNPSPDFRFLNDTGSYMLFRARVEGDDAVFELWGTSDGRTTTTTSPVIYNIIAPPPTKLIETTDLKPGEKRCTESAHSGADARFMYTVAYADGRVVEKEFKSHDRPWQAVFLIGVETIKDAGSAAPAQPDAGGGGA